MQKKPTRKFDFPAHYKHVSSLQFLSFSQILKWEEEEEEAAEDEDDDDDDDELEHVHVHVLLCYFFACLPSLPQLRERPSPPPPSTQQSA